MDFTLQNQWELYLKRVKLSEDTMPAQQTRELKRAFFGACGQMLILLRDDVAAIENEDECIVIFEQMTKECSDFWNAQTKG